MCDNPTAIITHTDEEVENGRWRPVRGDEAERVIENALPGDEGVQILESAATILSRGVSPLENDATSTGLIVGYVQSGKTLSFTTAIALAKDNGFRIVIVIAGTSVNLLRQSSSRLREDLFVDDVDGILRWIAYENPVNDDNNLRHIQQSLDEWRDPLVPQNERPTVLITVMKYHSHLENLTNLLSQLDLSDVPTLIIDDEADQASLNTLVSRGRGELSTTYRRLLDLRGVVPVHTFLQYTATPQAPLLINIIDSLSPDYVEVLQPGANYTGGQLFFGAGRNMARPIPALDVPSDQNPLDGPPESLLGAMRLFLVGVAAGLLQGRGRGNVNRSMMVHPSHLTHTHRQYYNWITNVFDEWRRLLDEPEDDPDRTDLIDDFREAYNDLALTVENIPPFDDIATRLARAFRLTAIEEVNANRRGGTPRIEWRRFYGWILVGGQAMDRGFTVEGLTVTYMPRGRGVGNADTVQQRARFFGYKRPYLGYCRIYLEQSVLVAFEQYVVHEEDMRAQLQEVVDNGTSLRDWKRSFILSPHLRPCRQNVIEYSYARGNYADDWYHHKLVDIPTSLIDENNTALDAFLDQFEFRLDNTYQSNQIAQQHYVCDEVPLEAVLSELLVQYRILDPVDAERMTGLLLQLSRAYEENPNEMVSVYKMRPEFEGAREIDAAGKINTIRRLFQGPTRARGRGQGYTYPGDMAFHDPNRISIQVHRYDLQREGLTVAQRAPILAVWVPGRMSVDWLVQEQPDG